MWWLVWSWGWLCDILGVQIELPSACEVPLPHPDTRLPSHSKSGAGRSQSGREERHEESSIFSRAEGRHMRPSGSKLQYVL
jgi:hypothetical protein